MMIYHQYHVTLRDAPRFMMDFLSAWGVPLFYLVVFAGYLLYIGEISIFLRLSAFLPVYFALLWLRQKRRVTFQDFVERVRDAAAENGETLPQPFDPDAQGHWLPGQDRPTDTETYR
ncbi:MAG: hypothetical protein LBC37_06505 [Zoogloeaceae bacterium]|jgi:hypothetical protein|nr:hypothetical protein [Zoogloeaceae bacterium]